MLRARHLRAKDILIGRAALAVPRHPGRHGLTGDAAEHGGVGDAVAAEPVGTMRAARILAPKLTGCEIFITTETKGIPLTHAIATYLSLKPYVVCRKEVRPFMLSPLVVRYKPITAKTEQELFIDGRDSKKLGGKKVGIVDDIVSTGETIQAMAELVRQAGGTVVKRAALLVEGDERGDVEHLGILPIFKLMNQQGGRK